MLHITYYHAKFELCLDSVNDLLPRDDYDIGHYFLTSSTSVHFYRTFFI